MNTNRNRKPLLSKCALCGLTRRETTRSLLMERKTGKKHGHKGQCCHLAEQIAKRNAK